MPRKSKVISKRRRTHEKASQTKPPAGEFWRHQTVEELAAEQGVEPIQGIAELRGDFWPGDESTDDFLAWLREVRRDGRGQV